jgi:hydroxymethylglutaryl-CoA lyase
VVVKVWPRFLSDSSQQMDDVVVINEVGLRDGLQNQPKILSTNDKLRLFRALTSAGLTEFEVTSFVSSRSIPQLADANAFLQSLPDDPRLRYTCLVPNLKGYRRALEAGARRISVVLAATDTMNRKNINMSLHDATKICSAVIRQAKSDGLFARAYIASAFACAYEGKTPSRVVFRLLDVMAKAGVDEIAIADTVGAANPREVKEIFSAAITTNGTSRIYAHFHDTRGLGSALVWSALESGVRRFDSSIAGLGGCPFAPGTSGNVATEDLVYLFDDLGLSSGVNLRKLFNAVDVVRELTNERAGGRVNAWYRAHRPGL